MAYSFNRRSSDKLKLPSWNDILGDSLTGGGSSDTGSASTASTSSRSTDFSQLLKTLLGAQDYNLQNSLQSGFDSISNQMARRNIGGSGLHVQALDELMQNMSQAAASGYASTALDVFNAQNNAEYNQNALQQQWDMFIKQLDAQNWQTKQQSKSNTLGSLASLVPLFFLRGDT